jgi:acyl-CoA synthetase (AMP-forming)/AMP-acid ligase II
MSCVADSVLELASREPTRVCVIEDDSPHRLAEVVADAEALACALTDLGVATGDVVTFQLPNWREAMTIDLASAMLGCVVNPVVPIYRGAEMEFILADANSRVAFVPAEFRGFRYAAAIEEMRPRLPDLRKVVAVRGSDAGFEALVASGRGRKPKRARVADDALKMLMYTSGTTGRAKAVRHSHATLGFAVRFSPKAWGIGTGTVVLAASPITHIASFCHGLEMPYILGTTSVLLAQWNAKRAVELIDRYKVSFIGGATPFLQELLGAAKEAGSSLPSLRIFSCGGAAVPPDLIHRAQAALPQLRASRTYGMTEAPWITRGFQGDSEGELAAETDGRIMEYELRIVDDEGRALPDGDEGEVVVRGPALFLGYADAGQTAAAFDKDGFFRTGDIGVKRGDAVTLTGRKKDLIIRGGENLSPKEIEDVLHTHPAVREAAAVSMPHARLGEGVCVYVIANAGQPPTLDALVAHCFAAGLAKQKAPERLELVADLPRTPSGKVRKDALRKEIAAKISAERASPRA